MQYKVEECAGCGRRRSIINRKHVLCQECNHKRLHPDKQPAPTPFRSSSIKKKSRKQQEIDAALHRTYEEIARERPHVCTGCGTTRHLSHSHLVSRSQRKDLKTDERNITYHCLSVGKVGCHDIWEHCLKGVEQMLDYARNMAIVKELDWESYCNRGGE